MNTVEKHLEEGYKLWFNILKLSDKQDPKLLSEYRWNAEYYRDGLAQYKMLHDPVLTFLIPRICLLTGLDIRKAAL